MVATSDPALLVLLTLRLRSFVDSEVVAHASRMPEREVVALLEGLRGAGFAEFRGGRIQGWALTTAGRIEGERHLAAELDATGCRSLVSAAYDEFVALNAPFLGVCTRWQLRADNGVHVLNEHDDPAYDAALVAELDAIDEAVQPICARLAGALVRFGWYNGRFAVARVRVHAGEHDWLASPLVDSYHSVWFELHENLLATLNLERSAEAR